MALIIQMICHTVMLAEPWDIHSRCESITDEEALKALASGCGGLTSVDLSYCRRITDEALKALAIVCGGLTSVVNLSDCISHLLCF